MTATDQNHRPPVPGLAERARRDGDNSGLTAPAERRDIPKRGRGNLVRAVLSKLMSALRGDKYMVDAYPAAGYEGAAAPAGRGSKAPER